MRFCQMTSHGIRCKYQMLLLLWISQVNKMCNGAKENYVNDK